MFNSTAGKDPRERTSIEAKRCFDLHLDVQSNYSREVNNSLLTIFASYTRWISPFRLFHVWPPSNGRVPSQIPAAHQPVRPNRAR